MKIIFKIEYSEQATNKQTTNESSMSGTTTTTTAANHAATYNHAATSARYIAGTEYGSQIFNGQRGDYGIYKFADPHRQMTYEHHETRFTKMQNLKNAYDKQELLCRMRADIRREYLTRKKQMKRLQLDASVDFRNAESSLQEHYATEAADHRPYIHGVDIHAPIVSQIQLPNDEILDLKTFDEEREFAKVCQVHADLLADQQESIRQFEQEEQRQNQYHIIGQRWMEREYRQQQQEQQQEQQQPELLSGCGDMECIDSCYSDDSDYFPREYNWERECREAEAAEAAAEAAEAAAEAAAEQQHWIENTRDSDGETWDEEARANEAEHRREVALLAETNDDDMTYTCDDHPDVLQLEVVLVTEPKARITSSAASSGGISAQKKAAAGAAKKAAKARQAKQELKKKAKFVPFKLTMNTNRVPVHKECCDVEEVSDMEEQEQTTTTLLYRGRAQVNFPKKNLQNVSLKGKKRHIAIWRRIEAAEKHASARGTRIANIPQPWAWYDEPSDYEF